MERPQSRLAQRIEELRRSRKPPTEAEAAKADATRRRYHAAKDLVSILESLVTGAGDARERLYHVSPGIMLLQREDFPEPTRAIYDEVRKTVERFEPYWESPVSGKKFANSPKRAVWGMRQSTAQKATQQLWNLYWSVTSNVEHESFEDFL